MFKLSCFYYFVPSYCRLTMNDNLFCFIIIIGSFLLYINSCFCGFVFDDTSAIAKNQDVLGKSQLTDLLWNDYWGMPMIKEGSHKSYRPFTVLTYRINHFLFGSEPWSYHVVNVILNCVACLLVFFLFALITRVCFETHSIQVAKSRPQKITKKQQKQHKEISTIVDTTNHQRFITYVGTLLFLVHPIHTEAVTGVVGRAEILSAIFFILAILSYAKCTIKSVIVSLIFCLLAVASKEQGITVLGVCIFYDVVLAHKFTVDEFCLILVTALVSSRKIKYKLLLFRTFIFVMFGVLLLCARYYIMQGELPLFTAFDNPAAASTLQTRVLTFNYLLPINIGLLLNPSNLLCDWTMGTIPLIETFSDIRNLATLLFWTLYICVGFFSVLFNGPECKMAAISIAIATFSFLPASNLFFPVGFVVAERVLYIPSIGFSLIVATGVWKIKIKYKCDRFIYGFLILLVTSHALKTFHRNFDWKSEKDLFKSGLKVTQRNAKIWNNVGHAYEKEKNLEEALKYFLQATEVQPDDLGAFLNVGRTYQVLGDAEKAESFYWKAKSLLPKPIKGKRYSARVAPDHLQVFVKLANLIKRDATRLPEADALYKEVIGMRPSFAVAHINRGEILMKMNKPKEALVSYQTALEYSNNKSDIYFNIGIVQSHMGNKTAAIEAYQYSIFHNPNHVQSLYNSAAIFEETREPGLIVRAKSRVEKILEVEPYNILAKVLLGSIYMDMSENTEAIKWWNEVLEFEPNQKATLFNIALLYSKIDGKSLECVDALERLFQHYPDHVKGLLLYGDIMLKDMQNIEAAERAYKHVMKVEPNNIRGRHNYCVALVEQSKLEEAEVCLSETAVLAPHENYIKENLALVRHKIALRHSKERSEKERKETNFKLTDAKKIVDKPVHEVTQEEDTILVAQPIKRKNSWTSDARKVAENVKRLPSDLPVEEKLKEAKRAVEKLEEIKFKVDAETNKKCKVKKQVETSDVKKKALEALDRLEALL